MSQDAINKELIRALGMMFKANLSADERLISSVRILQAQLAIIADHLEIDHLSKIQSDFRDLLAQFETDHERRGAEIEDLKSILERI